MTSLPFDRTAIPSEPAPAKARKIDKVPFVEMYNGRLQGVLSSDSDVKRVYCAYIEAHTGDYYSSTNNNRRDAGMAKRIRRLIDEAYVQFGEERVKAFLQLSKDPQSLSGSEKAIPAGEVFSRFLNYLRFVERDAGIGPVPEMAWFVG